MKRFRRSILLFGCFSLALAPGACLYGFAGGGLPSHVRTVAVRPFENLTPVSELPAEISERIRADLFGRLGVRDAAESRANAVITGTIQRYEADIPVGYQAGARGVTTAHRMVQLIVDVEVLDQVTGKTLWQQRALTAEAQYQEGGEAGGRREAISSIVNMIVEGAQSQW